MSRQTRMRVRGPSRAMCLWRRRLRWTWRLSSRLTERVGRAYRILVRNMYRLCCKQTKLVLRGDVGKDLNQTIRKAGLSKGALHQEEKLKDSVWNVQAQCISKRAYSSLRSWTKQWKYQDSKTYQLPREATTTQLAVASVTISKWQRMTVKSTIRKWHHAKIEWGEGLRSWWMRDSMSTKWAISIQTKTQDKQVWLPPLLLMSNLQPLRPKYAKMR